MVKRIFIEKKPGLDHQATGIFAELQTILGMTQISALRLLQRYDVEGLEENDFQRAVQTVLSEPQLDNVSGEMPAFDGAVFAVEYLPGQFDQRADSAAQCIQLLTQKNRPAVRSATVYLLSGDLTATDVEAIKAYVINPVESREATLKPVETLSMDMETPEFPAILDGFRHFNDEELGELVNTYRLAMDFADLQCCRDYFRSEHRDPTITELRILDTYWSDHCRHTTFSTNLTDINIDDSRVLSAYNRYLDVKSATNGDSKPVTLMDMAVRGTKYLKSQGLIPDLDESDEINACTVKIDVDEDGETKPWLLLFKNETHNHPTEIEPFGGAATCIGGAIRDPLSGRSYVYQAMRVTGAADPRATLADTMPGKLPQRKICQSAAAGYSAYGNQIGLATGLVDELYHPGYAAKRLEIGAVVGATPAGNVRREEPAPGDVVILVGGRTGRDGCGGATGSSKSHDAQSVATCSAEVQKGNPPEERKLQRLFRNGDAMRLVKRCNDFGAGGVSVAVGELADSLDIDLNAVPKKYDGLDATELAISESQERMAVVVEAQDVSAFMAYAAAENLESTLVATVTDSGRMTMTWQGKTVADLSRSFLNTNGAAKTAAVTVPTAEVLETTKVTDFRPVLTAKMSSLRHCSRMGLAQWFDSTIGAGSVQMPFGGKYQKTPTQSMVAKIPVLGCETTTCSVMAWGGNPFLAEADPYTASYLAVVESVSKVIAAGGTRSKCWLSFQEYFPRLGNDPTRWGLPVAALLGAFEAQLDLECAAIGGKDSMSGTFQDLDVPPTLVSFAVSVGNTKTAPSNELKSAGNALILVSPTLDDRAIPTPDSLKEVLATVETAIASGLVVSTNVVEEGGIGVTLMKAAMGNRLGVDFGPHVTDDKLFATHRGAFLLETTAIPTYGTYMGRVIDRFAMTCAEKTLDLSPLEAGYDQVLESVYPTKTGTKIEAVPAPTQKTLYYPTPKVRVAKPKVIIPVFPGTNCEYDSARAVERAGLTPEIVVIHNQTAANIAESVTEFTKKTADGQVIFIPGGFSGGDEPDGSAKFITAFFRNHAVKDATMDLLKNRDGLMLGICNGFQALIKLGLVPYGEILDTDDTCPTLTYNVIARHQSAIVRTRVASNRSVWLSNTDVDEIYNVPISHGEGRFYCSDELLQTLSENGQIATQYVDLTGNPTMDIAHNPNGSVWAIEGITSPDGRVLGKMGHSERIGPDLYQNVPGNYDMNLFNSAMSYFK
ncbi:MAG: phosphoribosylformylglycinamidine synthase [Eubacteriales bacterium]